ncbi:MAG: DUF89 family protein [Candidatus Aminicenantes bacterium]|nr:DUF89 family protein [Candidatus Aminicenantes bacterium]
MKACLDCYPCLFNQALRTARMITQDEKKILAILNSVSRLLPQLSFNVTPPEIGKRMYQMIAEMTDVYDPFQKVKQECTQRALQMVPEVKQRIMESSDRLEMVVRAAVAGNIIDFGAYAEFDFHKDLEAVFTQEFAINHLPEFKEAVKQARRIMYIGDNAGETVFDRLLIEEMNKPTQFAVREKPVINDAVYQDAVDAGLDQVAEIISSGSDAPGNLLSLCSDEFMEAYTNADLIISKGQGNYEALSEETRPIFFLLKAKCPVIARDIGVPVGSIILMRSLGD